jgi:hypothetical protein
VVKPTVPNEVWSADFVFDRTAEGRVLKCLAIVDDATTEAVTIIPARALGGFAVTRALDRLAATRGLPRVLRTDHGLEFCGRAMLTWAHERRVTLRLIEPGKPTPGSRGGGHRGVAPRIQRGAAEEGPRWADARRIRAAIDGDGEDGESNRRTLNRSATESGGTSASHVPRQGVEDDRQFAISDIHAADYTTPKCA